MAEDIKALDGVYNFSDARRALEEYVNQLRDKQRDESGPNDKGMYLNWELFYVYQGQIEAFEDILEAFTYERAVANLLREAEVRENVREGLRQSAAGEVESLGTFEQYAD